MDYLLIGSDISPLALGQLKPLTHEEKNEQKQKASSFIFCYCSFVNGYLRNCMYSNYCFIIIVHAFSGLCLHCWMHMY